MMLKRVDVKRQRSMKSLNTLFVNSEPLTALDNFVLSKPARRITLWYGPPLSQKDLIH